MKRRYIFDEATGVMKKYALPFRTFLWAALRYLLVALVLAMLWYLLFALIFNTDVEKKLKEENRLYSQEFSEMEQDLELLTAVVSGLGYRDRAIYDNIFQSDVPDYSDFDSGLAEKEYSKVNISQKVETTLAAAETVDSNFRRVFRILLAEDAVLPPLSAPVEGFSAIQAGASTGSRVSPFLKVAVEHDGLDIIAPSGTPVIAAADGTVLSVARSSKGHGNVVAVTHKGGYVTRYGSLGSISVRQGARLNKPDKLGSGGMSVKSYAPHIQYEVLRDTLICNPANYMFASVTPDDYTKLLQVSASTVQSLD